MVRVDVHVAHRVQVCNCVVKVEKQGNVLQKDRKTTLCGSEEFHSQVRTFLGR